MANGNLPLRDTWWDKVERALIGLLGLAAMIVGLVQVVGRYVAPRYAISWAEEVIVYLVVWGIMLAASQLVRTDGHVRDPDLLIEAEQPGRDGEQESEQAVEPEVQRDRERPGNAHLVVGEETVDHDERARAHRRRLRHAIVGESEEPGARQGRRRGEIIEYPV